MLPNRASRARDMPRAINASSGAGIVGFALPYVLRIDGQHRGDELDPLPRPGPNPDEELEREDAPGELVGARVNVLPAHLLGGHVRDRSGDGVRRRRVRRRAERVDTDVFPRDPESSTFTTPSDRIITFSGFTSR